MEKLVNGTKYNKSEIMRAAWEEFRHSIAKTFAECLRNVWADAKRIMSNVVNKIAEESKKNAVVRMHYGEYKNNYSDCRTVEGSYDPNTRTIEVLVNQKKGKFAFYTKRNGKKVRMF